MTADGPPAPLAERIADADESALEEGYRRYGPMVRAYLRRFVGDDEADDLLQVVFLEVWRSRGRIDPDRPFEGWLFGIARKRAIDRLRRSRHVVVPVESVRELVGTDGDAFVERMAWCAEVRGALASLPPEQHQAIELSYYEDMTQAEIATMLNVPLGTVKARLARGMRRLAATIAPGGQP